MSSKVIASVCFVLTIIALCSGLPASTSTVGKYQIKSNQDDGKYKPVKRNEGRYIHMVQPYVHTHDNRELGKYTHIPIPYNGGYGPYSGLLNPYMHDDHGNYDKYTTTTTTTRRPTTTTTTTMRPRLFNYHEEGGWRIIRQEEEKKKHKYDFLYLTENGIYGEEKAHLRKGAGTAASGYYEYTGDDGELYRVNYKSDERGFIPEADHIPTPPPVPDAIKRALEYVAKKKEIHGKVQTGQYEHKPGPVKLQNMPTLDRPVAVPVKPLAPPTIPPQPRFVQYNAGNQYNALPTGLGSIAGQQGQPQQYVSRNVAPYEQAKSEPEQPEPQPSEQVPLDQPQADQPQADQPQADQPLAGQLQSYQPQADQPQADQPQADQLQADQPQADQPQAQHALAEQPQADQPQAAPQTDQAEQQNEQLQASQQQPDQPQAAQAPAEEPQAVQPQSEEPQADQPQSAQPQAAIPQTDQPEEPQVYQPQAEQPQEQPAATQSQAVYEQQLQGSPTVEYQQYYVYPIEYVEQVPQASEQVNEFQPPYQVPEQLKDETSYELATA